MADHRMLAAQREAKRGYITCRSCGFTNFVRVVHCALCGLPRLSSNVLKTTNARLDLNIIENPTLPHAFKRYEWTRGFKSLNNIVWHRRPIDGCEFSPAYVLRFDRRPETEPEPETKASKQRERSLSTGYDPYAGVQFELLDVSDVDALQFPLPPSCVANLSDTKEMRRQMALDHALLDFPTKYQHLMTSANVVLHEAETKSSPSSSVSINQDFLIQELVQYLATFQNESLNGIDSSVHEIPNEINSEKDLCQLRGESLVWLNKTLVDPRSGLLSCTHHRDRAFYIDSQSNDVLGVAHLQHFYAAGRFIGRALLEGMVLRFHLCPPLLKMMLGAPISFSDLEYLDAEMYRHLTWLLDHDGATLLELDFTVTLRHQAQTRTVELIPTGRNIQVNDDNKFEFADRKFRYMMFESVAPQLASFLQGFYDIVPQHVLLPFDYKELDYLLCSSEEISVYDWQKHTHVALDFRREVTWFWDVVKEMSSEYRRRLMRMATGSSRVPLIGFQGLISHDGQLCKFTLIDASDRQCFRSQVGSNTLELPFFETKKELRTALYAALCDKSADCDFEAL
ncbi:uncharacterized protein CCR75_001183 [Bremia lactucae]|uniref:HECT-type E3 ubiquitin transferase n=1 Tax=Bremia lactucae TaxID=4779 RepID=A0A976IM38_BRELC|nr:hypothetical protein CCR75_001183 [Bremia lactucae]